MTRRTPNVLIGTLFVVGAFIAGYNAWAEKAYSTLDAASEPAGFPFFHPVRVYGYVIDSGILGHSSDPMQTIIRLPNVIHEQIIVGIGLMAVSVILWLWLAVTLRRVKNADENG